MTDTENKSALKRVWGKVQDAMPDISFQRAAVTLAFVGCMLSSQAKTIVGLYVDMDGDKTEILVGGERYQIQSAELGRAVTSQNQKKGGDVMVKVSFDENTSELTSAKVSHSPVRFTSGISDARSDIGNIIDAFGGAIGSARDANVWRLIKDVADAFENYSPETVKLKSRGVVRCLARNSEGRLGWAQYHAVDQTGYLKPQYDKSRTSTNSGSSYSEQSSYTSNSGYSQSSNSGYSQSSNSGYSQSSNSGYSQSSNSGYSQSSNSGYYNSGSRFKSSYRE